MARGTATANAGEQTDKQTDKAPEADKAPETGTQDVQVVEDGDVADAAAVLGDKEPSKMSRHMPNYAVEVVDELPEETPGGRKRLYFDLLTKAAQNPGSWVRIAHFQTPTGARNAQRDIANKKREIPEGEWEFKAIKVADSDNPAGSRHSQLYAKLTG